MYEIKIYIVDDSQSSSEFLVTILRVIYEEYPNILEELWKINNGVYAGYGDTVCSIEEDINTNKYLNIKGSELYTALVINKEYFYNVCIEINSKKLKLGVFDSSYVYLYSDSYNIVKKTIKKFNDSVVFKIDIKKFE